MSILGLEPSVFAFANVLPFSPLSQKMLLELARTPSG
jgi:hypothetical protein